MDDFDNFARHTWGWRWLSRVWVQHPGIRPSDRDGFVHVSGQLLFLDGMVGNGFNGKPTAADKRMVRLSGNVTCLYLRADPDTWDPDTDHHEPRDITHYFLLRGPFPAKSWVWDAWTRTNLELVRLLCIQWATWADMRGDMQQGSIQ